MDLGKQGGVALTKNFAAIAVGANNAKTRKLFSQLLIIQVPDFAAGS
jgi:hypothetical protein